MLSPEDRRKLDTIERRLSEDDPGLARALAAGPRPGPRRRRALVLWIAGGVLGVLLAVLLLGPGVLVVGVFLLLIGLGFGAFRGDGSPRPWWRRGSP
jgi:hypothetical protein